MWFVSGLLSLIGRILLCAVFVASAFGNLIPNFETTVEGMQLKELPLPNVLLIAAIAFLIVGSVSIVFGYKVRLGALLLLIFLCLVTYFYHDFWNYTDETERQLHLINFAKNLSLAGAMIWLIGNGGGAWSLDERQPEDDADFV